MDECRKRVQAAATARHEVLIEDHDSVRLDDNNTTCLVMGSFTSIDFTAEIPLHNARFTPIKNSLRGRKVGVCHWQVGDFFCRLFFYIID